MPNIYCRMTKIYKAGGRAEYITDDPELKKKESGRSEYITGNTGRQEEVVLHLKNMHYDWKFYSTFEKVFQHNPGQKQTEARELVIALPNDLAGAEKGTTTQEQLKELSTICHELAQEILGGTHDWEACVHWNHTRTNLHVHLMFSERSVVFESKPKRYSRDIWIYPESKIFAKAHADGAILLHRKGDLQRDKQGNLVYSIEPLTAKDPKFHKRSFILDCNRSVQHVLEKHGYHLDIQDHTTPYLSQRKLLKGASIDYLEKAKEYNKAVKQYNASVRQHLEIEPDKRIDYQKIRAEIEEQVCSENRKEKKISNGAIEVIYQMAEKVHSFVQRAMAQLKTDVSAWWEESKEQILNTFKIQLSDANGGKAHGRSERFEGNADDNVTAKPENSRPSAATFRGAKLSTEARIAALRDTRNCRENEEESARVGQSHARERQPQKIASGM